jgi:hypothetical protein
MLVIVEIAVIQQGILWIAAPTDIRNDRFIPIIETVACAIGHFKIVNSLQLTQGVTAEKIVDAENAGGCRGRQQDVSCSTSYR